MRRIGWVALGALLVAQTAAADEEKKKEGEEKRLPVAEAERPITLPRFVLSPEADFDVVRFPNLGTGTGGAPASASVYANFNLNIGFGITDDVTVRASVLPLQIAAPAFAGGFRYGQVSGLFGVDNLGPSVGATYRFLRGTVELGASVDVGLSTLPGLPGETIVPGIPVRLHLGESIRLDTGAYLPVTLLQLSGAPSQNTVGLNIPVSFLYDIIEPLHVGAATGFLIADFSDPGRTIGIPLTLFTGYAIAGKDGPILDIDPFFSWPAFFTPGTSGPGSSATATNVWDVGIALGGFFYL